jgi:D-tyrosyl-tRNA(Tyr) deacylase
MKVVIQRVTKASVTINNRTSASIGHGMMILLGVEQYDGEEDIQWLCKKITQLRIFDDKNGVMNLDIRDTNGEILLVSQFTLYASTRKGNRPSYIKAAPPDIAMPLYMKFINKLELMMPGKVKTGAFGAMMEVKLTNDGPVTIIIDSKTKE